MVTQFPCPRISPKTGRRQGEQTTVTHTIMAKKLSENVAELLKPFHAAIGEENFPKIVRDVASFLGEQKVTVDDGAWKTLSGFRLAAKDKHSMSLPANNPVSHLVWFAMRIKEIETASGMELTATLPKTCQAWIEQHKLRAAVSTPTVNA